MSKGRALSVATINCNKLHEESHPLKVAHLLHAILYSLRAPVIIALQEIGTLLPEYGPYQKKRAEIGPILEDLLTYFAPHLAYKFIEIPPLPATTGGDLQLAIRNAFLIRPPFYQESLFEITPTLPQFSGGVNPNRDELFEPSRRALHLSGSLYGEKINLINLHLKSMNARTNEEKKRAKRQRNAQAEAIAEYCHTLSSEEATLILGDFNDTPNSDTLKILLNDTFTPTWDYAIRGNYSYRYGNQPLVLDYILYNHPLKLEEMAVFHLNTQRINERPFSDHDPLLATFTL